MAPWYYDPDLVANTGPAKFQRTILLITISLFFGIGFLAFLNFLGSLNLPLPSISLGTNPQLVIACGIFVYVLIDILIYFYVLSKISGVPISKLIRS
jgi:hypothetical protein